jgi:hypothetical protein
LSRDSLALLSSDDLFDLERGGAAGAGAGVVEREESSASAMVEDSLGFSASNLLNLLVVATLVF